MMRNCVWAIVLAGLALLASCGGEDYVYPSVLTDVALLQTDASGQVVTLRLDGGKLYGVSNQSFTAPYADTTLRALVTYEPLDAEHAMIYNASLVPVLHDSTSVLRHDALAALSVWQSGGFINMHLQPKTQGQTASQYWGFGIDSLSAHHHHLSLHHAQNGDPASYSTDVYASIPLSQVGNTLERGDTVSLTIETFQGPRTWQFIYK